MANLSLRHIYKVYPNGVKAVSDFNMEIKDKEFIVFVGPSGCGKSTTLRMIAGLEDITAGELYIGNQLVNDVEPKDRDIAMVFQNYALYPHMTVYDNMAFGLKLRHMPAEEIHKKVLWAADVLKLTDYLDRKPRAMSGGQRQRVALGRAILRNPKVFLLDEPLSNLDAKLRTEMRAEIAKLHQQLQTTFIYVTHDQTEAMTLGTRVVVMKLGRIQQIDTPQNLYDYPENKFVAGFIGTPQMNFFEATLKRNKDNVAVKFENCDNELIVPFKDMLKVKPKYFDGKVKVAVGLRCENISLDPEVIKNSKNNMKIKVSHFEQLGDETLIYGDLNMKGDGFEESTTRVIVKSYHKTSEIKSGDVIEAAFDMKKAHFFDENTENTIVPRVPSENVFDCEIKDNVLSFLGQKVSLPKALETKNIANADLYVPTKAINFNGDIPAEVICTEDVCTIKLCYLKINERIFFAIVDKNYKAGEKVKIGFDFKQISISKDDVEIIKPLSEYDTYIGSFTNVDNNKKAIDSLLKLSKTTLDSHVKKLNEDESLKLGEIGYSDYLYKLYKQEYADSLEKNKQDRAYKIGTQDLGKEGKAKAQKEFKEANELSKKTYEEKIAKLDAIKAKKDEVKGNENEANSIKEEYKGKIDYCNNLFNEYKKSVLDGSKTIASKAKDDEKKLESVKKTELDKLTKQFNLDLNNLKAKEDATSKENKEKIKNLKAKFENDKNAIGLKSKLFFSVINGKYVETSLDINKKIIQALGVSVFRSNYRYEISHYDYEIVDKNGFEVKVLDIVDYGTEKFAKCECFGEIIYVSTKKDLKVGQNIYLTYRLDNAMIFENKFDIRLY
jgi:multiple sugar transport system ATP-binding protein